MGARQRFAILRVERDGVALRDASDEPLVHGRVRRFGRRRVLDVGEHRGDVGPRARIARRVVRAAEQEREQLRARARLVEDGLVEQVQERVAAPDVDDHRERGPRERDVAEVLLGSHAEIRAAFCGFYFEQRGHVEVRRLVRDVIVAEEVRVGLRQLREQTGERLAGDRGARRAGGVGGAGNRARRGPGGCSRAGGRSWPASSRLRGAREREHRDTGVHWAVSQTGYDPVRTRSRRASIPRLRTGTDPRAELRYYVEKRGVS